MNPPVAAKARGVRLGGRRGDSHEKATRARQDRAKRRAGNVLAVVEQIRRGGTTNHAGIAHELTACGVQTATGKGRWFPNSVRQLHRHEATC